MSPIRLNVALVIHVSRTHLFRLRITVYVDEEKNYKKDI